MPKGAIIDSSYSENSVEEVYEKILKNSKNYSLEIPDILDLNKEGKLSTEEELEIESYWNDKIQVLSNSDTHSVDQMSGKLPAGIYKEIAIILEPEIDWRHALLEICC